MGEHPTSAGDSAAYERRAVSADDVVIVSACRTALCKAKRGGFKDTPVDDLIAAVLKETIRRSGVEPEVGAPLAGLAVFRSRGATATAIASSVAVASFQTRASGRTLQCPSPGPEPVALGNRPGSLSLSPPASTHPFKTHSPRPPSALQAVGDVCFGSVMGPSSQRANECRIAMFLAGFPESVPVHTVNRQCSSGARDARPRHP